MLAMGLVLGPSLMAMYHGHPVKYNMQKYLPFLIYYESALLLFTHELHYIETFYRSLHIMTSEPTCV